MLQPFLILLRALLRGAVLGLIAIVIAGLLLVRWIRNADWPWDPTTTTTTVVDTPAPAPTAARAVAESCPAGYDRDAWFGDFNDATLAAVYARAANVDGWTGQPIPQGERSIDHIVPVKEAACSGLTKEQGPSFYNDLDNLILTTERVNSSKGEKEPGERATGPWAAALTPPTECAWVGQWRVVKAKWSLTSDAQEVARLAAIDARCATTS